jgi:hypothetical protein
MTGVTEICDTKQLKPLLAKLIVFRTVIEYLSHILQRLLSKDKS